MNWNIHITLVKQRLYMHRIAVKTPLESLTQFHRKDLHLYPLHRDTE